MHATHQNVRELMGESWSSPKRRVSGMLAEERVVYRRSRPISRGSDPNSV